MKKSEKLSSHAIHYQHQLKNHIESLKRNFQCLIECAKIGQTAITVDPATENEIEVPVDLKVQNTEDILSDISRQNLQSEVCVHHLVQSIISLYTLVTEIESIRLTVEINSNNTFLTKKYKQLQQECNDLENKIKNKLKKNCNTDVIDISATEENTKKKFKCSNSSDTNNIDVISSATATEVNTNSKDTNNIIVQLLQGQIDDLLVQLQNRNTKYHNNK